MLEKFGRKLKHARKLNKMTLEELALKVDSSKSYIWELEKKIECNPSAFMVLNLSRALHIPFEYLVDDDLNIGVYPNDDNSKFILKQIKDFINQV